jgi:hypothetical protein
MPPAVVAITAVAIALYQPLGFVLTMVLLLFTLTFGAERRRCSPPRRSARRGRAHLSAVRGRAQDAARARRSRILAMGTVESLLLGFSVALQPDVLWYAFLGCLVGTIVGVLPGIGPLSGISILLPGDLRARHHEVGRDAGRHLLRLAIRRLDHVDPDADPGRGRLGHDLHRRLRHGAERPRGRGPVHCRGRLLGGGHVRCDHADA